MSNSENSWATSYDYILILDLLFETEKLVLVTMLILNSY